jgi:phenylalanyl-tRNA synthetase alpha chain
VPGASDAGDGGPTPIALSDPERTVLVALRELPDPPAPEEELGRAVGLADDVLRGTLQRLLSKHLAVVEEEVERSVRATERGRAALAQGLPERRLIDLLARAGPQSPENLATAGLEGEARSAAIGILRRRGLLADGMPLRWRDGSSPPEGLLPEEIVLKQIANEEADTDPEIVAALERRGLVRTERRTSRRWAASPEGLHLPLAAPGAELLGAITPALLTSGQWKGHDFRPYDVRARVPFVTGARPNRYLAWLQEFEDVLIGLGFEEWEGPLLETEFWNNDALFMPQDHPARSVHDALSVEGVTGHPPPADLLARVAAVHEGRPLPGETTPLGPGWSTPYDVRIASRPVLRSQTTAVSARYLARRPKAPFRMYSVDRNFRREEVDARHHLEFGQAEGIAGEEGMTLRHLVGLFRELAEGIGIRELKIRPSYFPFTEPSIEGYVRHPRLGWMEVLPGGILRPEVARPLGAEVPVLAWAVGITRLALVSLGCNDIRELFDDDVDRLRGASS